MMTHGNPAVGSGADHGDDADDVDAAASPVGSTLLDRWLVGRIQHMVPTAPTRFLLWDGYEVAPPSQRPSLTIQFRNRPALLGWLWDPDLNFGETYMSGDVAIAGNLFQLLEAVYHAAGPSRRAGWSRCGANDATAGRENVHCHYDLGNDFYRLWLDRELVYSCAYFPTPDTTLEDAQVAKMDLVCRKLRLAAGERVVEAGCGWGS